MKVFKQTCQSMVTVLIVIATSTAANAQSKSSVKKDTVYSTIGINPIIKDEQGNVLTHRQMIALTKTGNYKLSTKTDANNKPYFLVEKAPGFAPRPESIPVVVRPAKKP